jgi:glycosyltransferase involved in cell wall biosynthesis
MQAKISIIVPVYNTEKYLPQCLDALVNQTLQDIEIICVDDGSTDDSAKIVQEYAKKDNRIRYVFQQNQGLSVTRNTGLKSVNAPYIMFCDSDDWYDASMCEKMYDAAIQNDVPFACCGIKMEYEIPNDRMKKSDLKYYSIKYSGLQFITQDMWKNIDASVCNKIFKKEILDKYAICFPSGLNYEDFCFFFQLLTVSEKTYFLPEYLYHYRRHNQSIMCKTFKQTFEKALDHVKILDVIYAFSLKNNLWDAWKQSFREVCSTYCSLARNGLPKDKQFLVAREMSALIHKWNLTDTEKQEWAKACRDSVIVVKVLGIKLLKIKRVPQRSVIFVLGVQLCSRKIKKGKEVYSILYVPVFKRKIKSA